VLLAISTAIGLALGLFNAVLIHFFRLPALIVTLGTASVIRGALLEFVGTRTITNLPSSIIAFSRTNLFEATLANGASAALTVSILFFAVPWPASSASSTRRSFGMPIRSISTAWN
jgi:simple sugar transport system permease protein